MIRAMRGVRPSGGEVRATGRALVLSVAFAAVLGLAACGSPGPETGGSPPAGAGTDPAPTAPSGTGPWITGPSTTGPSSALGDLRLTASWSASATAATVAYTVANASDRVRLVIDRIPARLGGATLGAVDPARAWVYRFAAGVRVSKQAFPVAPNVRFVAAPVIGARFLAPGARLTGTARVVLPPVLDVPGEEFTAPREPVDAGATSWQFCLQVATVDRPREVVPISEVALAPLVCSAPAAIPTG